MENWGAGTPNPDFNNTLSVSRAMRQYFSNVL
jgi:hypothetical protein